MRSPALVFLWLASSASAGCASAPRRAATEAAARPAPPPPEAEPEPATGEPSVGPTLHLGVDGPVVGWITDPGAASSWGPWAETSDGWIRLRPPIHSATSREGLVVHARRGSLSASLPELAPPTRSATGHHFVVRLEDGTPFSEFFCDEIEVLADETDAGGGPRARVRVRDERGRWIIEGWVDGRVEERGTYDCPPRVVAAPTTVTITVAGASPPPPPAIPPGFVRASPPDPAPDITGPVWLQRYEGDRLACQRWRVRRTSKGLRLERRHLERWGKGRSVLRQYQELWGGPIEYHEYGVTSERRWIRRPGPDEGMPGEPGAHGCVFPMTLLAVDARRITWVEAHAVVAYHPDDARYWYRTRAACEAALPD